MHSEGAFEGGRGLGLVACFFDWLRCIVFTSEHKKETEYNCAGEEFFHKITFYIKDEKS